LPRNTEAVVIAARIFVERRGEHAFSVLANGLFCCLEIHWERTEEKARRQRREKKKKGDIGASRADKRTRIFLCEEVRVRGGPKSLRLIEALIVAIRRRGVTWSSPRVGRKKKSCFPLGLDTSWNEVRITARKKPKDRHGERYR